MADPVRMAALRNELDNDPAGVGYTAVATRDAGDEAAKIAFDQTDLALLLAATVSRDRPSVTASQLDEAIDEGEEAAYAATGTDEDRIRAINRVFQIAGADGTVDIRSGTKARAKLELAFAGVGGSTTRTALGVLLTETIPRTEAQSFGGTHLGDIQAARVFS